MEKENQISDTTTILMIGTALFFDFFQAVVGWIPAVGNILAAIISIFAFMTFFLWFYMNGIRMISPKRLTGMIGGGVIELVPYLNILPAWTMVVVYLIGTTKIKEMAAKHPTLAAGAVKAGMKIKSMNKTGKLPHVPFVDER